MKDPKGGLDAGIAYKNNGGFIWGYGGGTALVSTAEIEVSGIG